MSGNQSNNGPGHLHLLPKIHQIKIDALEHNNFSREIMVPPGRPIISRIGTITEYLSR